MAALNPEEDEWKLAEAATGALLCASCLRARKQDDKNRKKGG